MDRKVKPKTMSVPEAGWVFLGIGENSSYRAAKLGIIPTLRVGGLLRVPVAAMEAMLAERGQR